MASLAEHLAASAVAVGLSATGREDAIRKLAGLLSGDPAIRDPEALVEAVLERESLTPTGVGEGCALPHAHTAAVAETRLAMATLRDGVDFEAPDGKPARIVVLMVGPKESAGLHLKLLAKLARLLHDASFREEVLAAADPAALRGLVVTREA